MDRAELAQDFIAPHVFEGVYVTGTGIHLPGAPVDNEHLDDYIAPLNSTSPRLKRRVLYENGILTRHYAIDTEGNSVSSAAQMAAHSVLACLEAAGVPLPQVSLLATGTSGGDTVVPGFANMVQGELGAPPMETSSHQGVCASGVSALKYAASAVERGEHRHAIVAASEMPSRLFKKTRFAPRGYNADFDSHFLRWMLSDGSGALLLSGKQSGSGNGTQAAPQGAKLRLKWVHLRSFSGDYPVCMQVGSPGQGSAKSYLDYPSLSDADADGAFLLRQDVRLLPHLFDVGIHEYARLINGGFIDPSKVDHFLCHYSSEKFRGVIGDLMDKANLRIPDERWYSNLKHRGNTGSASIFIMLGDFLREKQLRPGEQILCFVPESGRFTVSFIMFEVVEPGEAQTLPEVPPPHEAHAEDPLLSGVLRELADVWHEYRSRIWRSRLIQKITTGQLTVAEYCQWMSCWIPQVREGTIWMRRAVDNLDTRYEPLKALISQHAGEEQFDYHVLFNDYQRAGGSATHVDALRRNAGGEALNAYMHHRAAQLNPVGLLGGIYIIEGTGQRVIPALLPMLRKHPAFAGQSLEFLRYHAENDVHHLERWLAAVNIALQAGGAEVARDIVQTARATAQLYALQMEAVL